MPGNWVGLSCWCSLSLSSVVLLRYSFSKTLHFSFNPHTAFQMYANLATSSEKQTALLSANVVATEAISNVRTVASYCNEGKMLDRYGVELLKPKAKGTQYAIKLGLFVGIGQFCVLCSNAMCMYSLVISHIIYFLISFLVWR